MPNKDTDVVYWLDNKLYLNITNKCSNRCYFCLREFRTGINKFNLKLDVDPSISEIISQIQDVINTKNWDEIVFCGFGEPLERLDCVLEVSRWIRKYYGKILKIRVDTNGHGSLLNKERDVVKELKEAGVNKLSISLNAPDKETYDEICKPMFPNAYEAILEFIFEAKSELEVEITAVTIPETDLSKIERIARKIGVDFRLRRYLPGFL